jgi:hypothetical protein
VIGVCALVLTPAASPETLPRAEQPAVALAAQVQPLPAPPTSVAFPPLELLGQQVNFHIGLLVVFVVTGAQLVDRQLQIPGTLVQDIQNGTPLPVAVGRALQTFAEIEFDAGRELVGFAVEYVDFQLRFLAELSALPFAVAVAVGEFVGSLIAGLTPVPVAESSVATATVSASAMRASATPPYDDDAVETVEIEPADTAGAAEDDSTAKPRKRKVVVAAPDSDSVTTLSAQGEVRSGATETTDVDDATATTYDDAPKADEDRKDERRDEPDVEQTDNRDTDDASQSDSRTKDNAGSRDSL